MKKKVTITLTTLEALAILNARTDHDDPKLDHAYNRAAIKVSAELWENGEEWED